MVALVAGSLATAVALPCCWWSGPLEWPPDSSSTLSPDRCVTLLFPVLLGGARFCRGVGWGVEGKQVGSMDEEPEVRDAHGTFENHG